MGKMVEKKIETELPVGYVAARVYSVQSLFAARRRARVE
jgi:hypothetical protein